MTLLLVDHPALGKKQFEKQSQFHPYHEHTNSTLLSNHHRHYHLLRLIDHYEYHNRLRDHAATLTLHNNLLKQPDMAYPSNGSNLVSQSPRQFHLLIVQKHSLLILVILVHNHHHESTKHQARFLVVLVVSKRKFVTSCHQDE